MFIQSVLKSFGEVKAALGRKRERRAASLVRIGPCAEPLESRTMLSESASAQLNLVSTTRTQPNAVYNYNITLTDTGTTKIGTFWFGWVPGEDFLPSAPSTASSPSGWGNASGTSSTPFFVGSGNSFDGTSIQWVAQSASADLSPGQSLSGFTFSTVDSPTVLAGQSPTHPGSPALTSFVYQGAPLGDPGFNFVVSGVPAGAAASTTSLVTSASTITAGSSVTFTATVAPASPGGATPTGTVNFLDNGTLLHSVTVQSDGTAALTTSSLTAGSHNITAMYSGDTTYAASSSTAVSETVNAPVVAAIFAPTISKSTLPASIVGGALLKGTVTVGLANQSGSLSKGSVTVAVYASTDGTIDGSATLLATVTRRPIVSAGKSVAVAAPVHLPSGLSPGSYTLLARATDSASQTQDSAAGPALQVQTPVLALTESFTRISTPKALVAGTKTSALAALKITDVGNIPSSGSTEIALYLSTDGMVDGTATLIKAFNRTLRILPNKSMTLVLPFSTVPTVPANNYLVVAQVTDPMQQITTQASFSSVVVST